ncbi:2-C-methyl-D-erythritol 4-phosphate cytidylyltransferase [Clostridium acetireducens DSM 10703]|jgi:2-C-methyl-D-erythritol 4-phosphate cytidylyltransferase|uniref:2-C-methyl-D-erythritol 4-phosphate cytidylyltransferase n=1 Tax=Clostridium acetireducens DSM 10703 TaxID=1121290 RepID=A0A1E8F0I7_9CLOT|nr:2-C-methyl-D-erythritol 4-phosphate cytidylyltransferase [Clostridium acetireducens]OFI06918.1 2-C-methyl-D-erythritol 4-phosphate cytidylyltransferase [Clostridium acetireducens DSM 10703]
MNKTCAIVLAAGKGKRMKSNINKQFIKINDMPILAHTLNVFNKSKYIDKIILVAAEDEISYCKEKIICKYNFNNVVSIVKGGKERQNSVYNGLKAVKNCNIVLIHDGARPFISDDIIKKGIEFARIYGAAACGVMPKDTIKIKDTNGFSKSSLNRENLFIVQTPQCFKYDLIRKCHEKLIDKKVKVTDDTSVLEIFNYKTYLYDGDYSNIKITTPEDLIIAKEILKESKQKIY